MKAVVAIVPALAIVAHWPALTRSGYSPDEEISIFAVRGISSTGLPRLPSGLVYDRGVLFSYAAWVSGKLFGDTLPSYRVPSFVGGVAAALLAALVGARLGGSALAAGLLAATATWLAAASSWARFYALFVAAFLAAAVTLLDPGTGSARRGRWFLAALVAARLLHEMAFTLVALPLFFLLQSPPASEERRWATTILLQSIAALVAVQLVLVALTGGGTVLSTPELLDASGGPPGLVPALLRLGSPTGLALLSLTALGLSLLLRLLGASWSCCAIAAVCSATLSLGLLLVATAALMLVRPERARVTGAAGVALGLATLTLWSTYVSFYAPSGLGVAVAESLARAGLAYPFAAASAMTDRWPLTTLAALGGLVVSWKARNVRSVAFLSLALLVALGAIDLGPRPRYFVALLPLLFAMASVLPVAVASRISAPGWRAGVATAGLTLLLAGPLLVEHERGRDILLEPGGPLGLSRLRTSPFERWAELLRGRIEGGPIVCTDDLACLLVGQAPTYWWLASETEAATYGFRDAGGWRSTYTGARILVSNPVTGAMACDEMRGAWVIALDTLKYRPAPIITAASGWVAPAAPREAAGMTLLRAVDNADPAQPTLPKEVIPCPRG
jgi:hypothetical protein